MAYTPKEWECGEVVTADALNHIEQGIADVGGSGSEIFVVNFEAYKSYSSESYAVTADKTFEEIVEAYNSGAVIVFKTKVQSGSNPYNVYVALPTINTTFDVEGLVVAEFVARTELYSGYCQTNMLSNGEAHFQFSA